MSVIFKRKLDLISNQRYNNFPGLLIVPLHPEDVYWNQLPKPKGKETLILDNASIHLARESKLTASRYCMKMLGLPPYWQHLAPVEFVFGLVKGFIKNSGQWKSIDYSKRSGKIAIMRGLECLTRAKALRIWRKVIRIGRDTILEVYEEVREASKDQHQNNK